MMVPVDGKNFFANDVFRSAFNGTSTGSASGEEDAEGDSQEQSGLAAQSAAAANRKRWRRAKRRLSGARQNPVGGAVRERWKGRVMVTFRRKAAEGNPASTAALRRVAISLNQRRALRHRTGQAHLRKP